LLKGFENLFNGRGANPLPEAGFALTGPFSDCIGAGFATVEAALLLATIAQQFRVNVASGQMVEVLPSVTLRPRSRIRAILTGR
jgi:hypothetical protein